METAGDDFDEMIQSQDPIHSNLISFGRTMALKCAVELRLADIIHSHDTPITISKLASLIDSPTPPDASALERVLRLLVYNKIFTAHYPSDVGGETLYGPSKASAWIQTNSDMSLAPLVVFQANWWLINPWSCFNQCVKEGGTGFEKAHGCKVFEFASKNPEYNKLFNNAMACNAKLPNMAIVKKFKDGFKGLGSLVDVGGGLGETIAAIIEDNPHINGINFDLPHVVSMAPPHNGVTHVGGSMLETIPHGDAVMLKWVLHNWNDEKCGLILQNCLKAIPEKTGKVFIVDKVMDPENEMHIFNDLAMLAITGGKTRTECQWKKILESGGFHRYKITDILPSICIIEAYQEY